MEEYSVVTTLESVIIIIIIAILLECYVNVHSITIMDGVKFIAFIPTKLFSCNVVSSRRPEKNE